LSLATPTARAVPARPGRRARVLWLVKGLDPGGAELLLSMAAQVRDRESFDYEAAYLLPWKRGLVDELEASGVPVHCLQGGPEWDTRWVWRLRHLVRERQFDVVHIHSPYVAGLARPALKMLPTASRPRIVYTEHLPWPGYVWPTRLLNRMTFALNDKAVAVSSSVRDSVSSSLRRKVQVVIHGVFAERMRQQSLARDEVRTELGIEAGELVVGTVAHLRRQKGYPVLLEAARQVIDSGLAVRFVAVGQGPEQSEIRSLHRQLKLNDRFLFTGFRSDAVRVMSAFDIFVLASWNEGLPVTVMEALTLGIPVVATAVGGTPEILTSGVEGLLVPPGRPDELAKAIDALAGDPDRRREMAEAAVRRAPTFDIRAATRTLEAIYSSMISLNLVRMGESR
jgi:glycosyltransferase involved in cell wall biosynthesis